MEDFTALLDSHTQFITRGNGRCYGDASLAPSIVTTTKFNRILFFDEQAGVITCQAGTLLSDILDVTLPKGWFLPVTPGTKYITVGGAVASDVHGKNHHKEGSFARHIISMTVLTPRGELIRCSTDQQTELFQFTCGGMGLTGIILEVTFHLKMVETGYIDQLQVKARNLDEILDLFERYSEYSYSVAWIDCLSSGSSFGRSILMLGEHTPKASLAASQERFPSKANTISVPFNFPSFVLSNRFVKVFNALFYMKQLRRENTSTVSLDSFFYPLDMALNWNRIYGNRGFIQYQFVIPKDRGKEGMHAILSRLNKRGLGSFLAVLKLFGAQDGPVSFPLEGYTLALDMPITSGLFKFLDELDLMVKDYGGRIYLTKDARMKPEIFHATYSNAAKFMSFLSSIDPDKRIVSSLSTRLNIK
jgi:FAD/FMN-containing dehydrogenase